MNKKVLEHFSNMFTNLAVNGSEAEKNLLSRSMMNLMMLLKVNKHWTPDCHSMITAKQGLVTQILGYFRLNACLCVVYFASEFPPSQLIPFVSGTASSSQDSHVTPELLSV